MDTVKRDIRSKIMAAVKSRGNRSTEQALRASLVRAGISGWRMHAKDLPGCPDFAFDEKRIALFVHGCFWHGHNCARGARTPKTNQDYWIAKINRNKSRDGQNLSRLNESGWSVITVWECEIKSRRELMTRITTALNSMKS